MLLTVMFLTTVLAGVIVAMVLRRPAADERRYPDSRRISLQDALQWADLRLPVCAEQGVRYGTYSDALGMSFGLVIRISATDRCIEQFLSDNTFTGTRYQGTAHFVSGAPKARGWPAGASKLYTRIAVNPSVTRSLQAEIAMDLAGDRSELFLDIGNS